MNALAWITLMAIGQGGAAAPQTATYSNDWIGISLSHPANWKVTPKKQDAWITIPLKNGTMVAGLNLVAATFQAETDVWQKSQEHINNQLGFEVLRQWQEEILGVPFLLTKVRSGAGKLASATRAVPGLPNDQPLITLIGLVYSATPRKLMFRLSAPEGGYDDAEFLLRQSLESLRTLDGRLPQPEDPNRKPDPNEPVPTTPTRPPTKTTIGAVGGGTSGANGEKVRAPQVFEALAATRKIGFYFPNGWAVEKSEDGKLSLANKDLSLNLGLELNSTLDSEPPLRALMKASAESLKRFEKVGKREENSPKTNKAGALIIRVIRTGTGSGGNIWSFESVGGSTDFYFLLRGGGSGELTAATRKALEDLIESLSVEPIA
ncbi:MAG TPA: hypothetical protein PLX06_00385 [Fimbriimonadaceae bacterium]|nr:hypothetical protein [Fimbriimonadaceae bacterium]